MAEITLVHFLADNTGFAAEILTSSWCISEMPMSPDVDWILYIEAILYRWRTVFPVAKSQADAARRDEFRHHNYATYSQCIVSQLVLSLMASGDDSGAIPYGYVFQIWQSNHFHGLLRFY